MPDSNAPPDPSRQKRDGLSVLGMAAVAMAAAFSSYSGLANLAHLAGWNPHLALLLPVTVDAYAMTATRVWLSPATRSKRARRWARGNAIGAILTSVLGNAIAHAAAAHEVTVSWPVVVGVSAIPSIVVGLIAHLWHLAGEQDGEPAPTAPGPAAVPEGVQSPYPILADPTAPPPTARRALPTGGARDGASTAPPAAGPSQGPKALPRGSAVRNTPKPAAKPANGEQEVRTDEELLDAGRLIAAREQRAPSANRLVTELHIGPTRARRIADRLAAEPVPSDAAQHTPPPTPPPADPQPAEPPSADVPDDEGPAPTATA